MDMQRALGVSRAPLAHVLVVLLLSACGGSGGEDSPAVTVDLSGDWAFVITRGPNTCGDLVGESDQHVGTVAQAGSEINVEMPFGSFAGTVAGAQATVSGTFADDGGYTTFVAWTLAESPGGLTGTAQWTWNLSAIGSPVVCEGTSDVIGTHVPQPPPPPPPPSQAPDFLLADVNPNSPTFGLNVSPRHHLGRVSAWYFGAAT